MFLVIARDEHARQILRITGLDQSPLICPSVSDFLTWNGGPSTGGMLTR